MKKEWCPKKHENHEEFYREHPEFRTDYWMRFFNEY